MDLFSISQLAQYSGIKPHTIRAWEQRYGALQPTRSEGNTRYYDGEQLRRLLNIVSLMERSYKVSELCSMSDNSLSKLILSDHTAVENEMHDYFISQLISAGMSYDELLFEQLFEKCVSKLGMVETYKAIINPLLIRVGLMWSADTLPTVQEHFISNLVRKKILSSTNELPPARSDKNKWLLFLSEDEFHEIGLLIAAFILRQSGHPVVYLGSSLPFESVLTAVRDTNPRNLLLFLIRYNFPEEIQELLYKLNKAVDGRNIYVAGNSKLLSQIDFPNRVTWLEDIGSLEQLVFNN